MISNDTNYSQIHSGVLDALFGGVYIDEYFSMVVTTYPADFEQSSLHRLLKQYSKSRFDIQVVYVL